MDESSNFHSLRGDSATTTSATRDSGFFEAFGRGATNRHPQNMKPNSSKTDQDDGQNSRDPTSYNHSPIGNSPTMAGWQTEMRPQLPPSPPGSATLPPKMWSLHNDGGYPPNLFSHEQPYPRVPPEFGQITPPDDEAESVLDTELQRYEHQRQDELRPSQSTLRARKAMNQQSSPLDDELPPPPKRTRKYTPRKPKRGQAESGNAGDARRSKFLERNRVAASKCRLKKKEWTQKLEGRARDLQSENGNLRMCVDSLNDEVFYLKNQMTEHRDCDCTAIQDFITNRAQRATSPKGLLSRNGFGSLPPSRARTSSTDISSSATDVSATKSVANDESALEALLSSSINHDTSDEGIAKRVKS